MDDKLQMTCVTDITNMLGRACYCHKKCVYYDMDRIYTGNDMNLQTIKIKSTDTQNFHHRYAQSYFDITFEVNEYIHEDLPLKKVWKFWAIILN